MEAGTRTEQPEHTSISLPLEADSPSSPSLSPPSDTTVHTMYSDPVYSASAYPREADTDSDTATESSPLQMEEDVEDPLYFKKTQTHSQSPLTPSHFSPPHSPHSLTSPLIEPTLRHQTSISEDLLCTICASVLHDPMSLHCGHSFCQLCLASMWKSSGKPSSAVNLKCPVCRSSWRNFPGVNIQLRNIIERTHPQKSAERSSAMMAEDNELLFSFKKARDMESQQKDKVAPQLRQEEVRRLVTGLCCIFLVVLALLILLFSLVFWVWAGAGGEFMRKPVGQWNHKDVAEWVGGLGKWATHNYSQIFLAEHITGQRLLQLDEAALKAIGIKNDYRRQSILYAIKELRAAEYSAPRNFDEFKAAHRRQTLVITMFYCLWPRLTLLYTYVFNYYEIFLPFMRYHFPARNGYVVYSQVDVGGHHDRGRRGDGETEAGKEGGEAHEDLTESLSEPSFRELLAMFVEIMLIPHFLVALFAWSWTGKHPWIAYPIIVHCVVRMWAEGKQVVLWLKSGQWASWQVANLRTELPQFCKNIFNLALKQYFFFVVFLFIVTMLWHVTPHFICDIIFYYIVWQTLGYNVLLAPFLACMRFLGGGQAQFQMHIQHGVGQQQRPTP